MSEAEFGTGLIAYKRTVNEQRRNGTPKNVIEKNVKWFIERNILDLAQGYASTEDRETLISSISRDLLGYDLTATKSERKTYEENKMSKYLKRYAPY